MSARKPDPARFCEVCGGRIIRPRYANGELQDFIATDKNRQPKKSGLALLRQPEKVSDTVLLQRFLDTRAELGNRKRCADGASDLRGS
jgi:hypothetical protein